LLNISLAGWNLISKLLINSLFVTHHPGRFCIFTLHWVSSSIHASCKCSSRSMVVKVEVSTSCRSGSCSDLLYCATGKMLAPFLVHCNQLLIVKEPVLKLKHCFYFSGVRWFNYFAAFAKRGHHMCPEPN
jgi:hypothetical protein